MRGIVTLMLLSLLLAGCTTAEQRARKISLNDHRECVSYGFEIGTQLYLSCRQMQGQRRAQASAQRLRASQMLIHSGNQLMQMGQPRYLR